MLGRVHAGLFRRKKEKILYLFFICDYDLRNIYTYIYFTRFSREEERVSFRFSEQRIKVRKELDRKRLLKGRRGSVIVIAV